MFDQARETCKLFSVSGVQKGTLRACESFQGMDYWTLTSWQGEGFLLLLLFHMQGQGAGLGADLGPGAVSFK